MFFGRSIRVAFRALTLVLLTLFSALTIAANDKTEYKTIEWETLLPQADLDAFMNPPEYLNDIEDGSDADQIMGSLSSKAERPDDEWNRALTSVNVVEEMNKKPLRIPGFIVPLDYDDDQNVLAFFLVPFFGACIHVPPPPPNQIIYMTVKEGFELVNLYDPVWVSGVLQTSLTENDMATSAYSMQVDLIEPYEEGWEQ